jgi:hypothetical protein
MDEGLRGLIAKTIKDADSSYFWEDYSKQATAVINAISAAGYVLVPYDPSLKMIQAGVNAVMIGKTQPHELARQIYNAMIRAKR